MDLTIGGLAFTPSGAAAWGLDGGARTGTAGARTDLFVDPGTGTALLNAPRLLAPAPTGDFQLAARVSVEFTATYDAGALLLWRSGGVWAKHAFEYSPQRTGMVVSVVTRGRSDDANGYTVDGPFVWLRISRVGPAYALHASRDGVWWDLMRHFDLGAGDAAVGLEVQSPTGDGCRATFRDISFDAGTLADLRDGR